MSGANSSWPMPPPPPAPSASALDNVETEISPSIPFIVAILAIVFFVCGLLHLLARHLLRLRRRRRRAREDADSVTAFEGQLQQLFHLHDAGVDQASIDALPVFLYGSVVVGGQGKDPFDCAVCLCEFSPDDRLRLLPQCSHAFHLECIDTWLLSHSTCPLCRRSLLAELSPMLSSPVVVAQLGSESVRDMAASADGATHDDADGSEPSDRAAPAQEGPEEVVEVKLGKFMCVEGNNASASATANDAAADGAGTSGDGDGGANAEEGLGQRRCHSMGSYEYVMDDRASLRVAIKPPKKKPAASKSRRRGAMSECELGASKREETSLRLPFPATVPKQQQQQRSDATMAKLAKDSFSVSKIWMVPSSEKGPDAAGERRAVSFRWPVRSKDEGDGKDRKSGSEADWDAEAGSGGGDGNSAASSLAEDRPSFARRTLLWVVGGGRQQSRVGSCS